MLCFLLVLGGLVGVGVLLYILDQKKAGDSGDSNKVAVTTPEHVAFTPVNPPAPVADQDKTPLPPAPPDVRAPALDWEKAPTPPPPPLPPPPSDTDKTPPEKKALEKKPLEKTPPPPAPDPAALVFEDFGGVK